MKTKWMAVGIILLFMGTYFIPAISLDIKIPLSTSRGNWLYVGGDGPGNYTKIQDAINHANDGDTVFVFNGTYIEFIIINRSITLLGQDKTATFITGYVAFTVSILTDGVTMSDFTIQNNGLRGEGVRIDSNDNTFFNNIVDTPHDEIRVAGDNNTISCNTVASDRIILSGECNNISFNTIANNKYGIFFVDSWGNTISNNSFIHSGLYYSDDTVWNNVVTDNTVNGKPLIYLFDETDMVLDSLAGQILLINCTNITVINQDLSNTTVGIQTLKSDSCVISGNTFTNNMFGILLNGSDNAIFDNSITNTNSAIYLSGTINIISHNRISHNAGSIYLASSMHNVIFNNTVTNNIDGIVLENGCDFNSIVDNTVEGNNYSGIIIFRGDGNMIYRNTLYDNNQNSVSGDGNIIVDNTITKNDEGIDVFGEDNFISDNTIAYNDKGIIIIRSHHANIYNNTLSYNQESIIVKYSDHNDISQNIINNNDQGINLVFCNGHNHIMSNTITMNTKSGIDLNCTRNTSISLNTISYNGQGIHLMSSQNNTIVRNTFQRNARHALFENCTNTWDDNYWGRPRILPKLIFGIKIGPNAWQLPHFEIDWHPASRPYT
jgi:parallel beta-helix repeat protein